jgi:DNA-binding transcriptional regulator YhcF (GntR family)
MDKGKTLTNGFLIIPQEILTTAKYNGIPLGFAEKCVYAYLLNWSINKEHVFPSVRKMCIDLGVGSRNSIMKYLNKLEELNLLSIEKTKGKSSNYTVLPFNKEVKVTPKEDTLISGTNIKSEYEHTTNIEWNHDPFDNRYDPSLDGFDLF